MEQREIPANRAFFANRHPPEGPIVGRQTRCYARPSLSSRRSWAPRVEQPIELTAETLWTEVSGRLKGALNDSTYRTWFGEVEGHRDLRRGVHPRGSERLHARVDRGPFPRADPRSGARCDRPAAADPADRRRDRRGRRPRRHAAAGAADQRVGPEHEVHVRPLRDRLVQPFRARGRARRRRGAGAGVQPALHLRVDRPREDAPAPGDRAVRDGAPREHVGEVRHRASRSSTTSSTRSATSASRASSSATGTTTCC